MAQGPAASSDASKEAGQSGQAPPASPPDPWIKALSELPAAESKPLSGATTVAEGAGYPAELVALSQLNDATSSITTALTRVKATHVLIVEDRALLDSEAAYLSVTQQVTDMANTLKAVVDIIPPAANDANVRTNLIPPGVVAGLIGAIPKLVGGAADIVGMFRTNYTMSSRTMTPEGTPLVAQVARHLLNGDGRITVSIDGFASVPAAEDSGLLRQWNAVVTQRRTLETNCLDLRARVAATTATVDTLLGNREAAYALQLKALEAGKSPDALEDEVRRLDGDIATARSTSALATAVLVVADAALAAAGALETALFTAPAGGRSPIMSALARESLHGKNAPSHVLFVSLDSVGAEVAAPASQLGKSDDVSYLGGLQVSYLVYEVTKAAVVAAGVERRLASARLNLKDGTLSTQATSELR
ncbi:MAG: hypothetical protein KBB39_13555 [Phycicoccus sp.]|nr:hypothetical protein [Phycicoccus sp.]